MQDELDIVRDVSARFDTTGIGYMLTGSMAMTCYAEPPATRDIELIVSLRPDDVERLVALFSPDYYISAEAVESAIARQSLFNLIHQKSGIKVGCIIRKQTEYHLVEFNRRKRIIFGDFETWMVSKEDLVISRLLLAGSSESDLIFREVQNLVSAGCDRDYIGQWARELGLDKLWQEISPG